MKTALGIRDVGFKSSRKRASNENEVNSIIQKLPFTKVSAFKSGVCMLLMYLLVIYILIIHV